MGALLYTIGYAGYPELDGFIAELKKNGVTTLIDIRRRPYESYYEQYDDNNLRNAMTREDMAYIRFEGNFGMGTDEGDEGEPESPIDFEETAKTEAFGKGIARLRYGMEKGLVPVIMGEAAEPVLCARGLLIARVLHEMGYTVKHIMPGRIKDHAELEEEIRDFAKREIRSEETGEYQLSLIPPAGPGSSLPDSGELLAEGYRRLNRLLF